MDCAEYDGCNPDCGMGGLEPFAEQVLQASPEEEFLADSGNDSDDEEGHQECEPAIDVEQLVENRFGLKGRFFEESIDSRA